MPWKKNEAPCWDARRTSVTKPGKYTSLIAFDFCLSGSIWSMTTGRLLAALYPSSCSMFLRTGDLFSFINVLLADVMTLLILVSPQRNVSKNLMLLQSMRIFLRTSAWEEQLLACDHPWIFARELLHSPALPSCVLGDGQWLKSLSTTLHKSLGRRSLWQADPFALRVQYTAYFFFGGGEDCQPACRLSVPVHVHRTKQSSGSSNPKEAPPWRGSSQILCTPF